MSITPAVRLGVDIGFGDVKVVSCKIMEDSRPGIKQFKLPSAIARVRRKAISGLEDAQIEYEFEKRKYLVGRDALASANIIPTRDIEFILEFSPLMIFRVLEYLSQAYRLPMESICNRTEICLGLPLAYYKSRKKQLSDRLTCFEVMGQSLNCRRLAVQAQGQGILLDFLLDSHCRPNGKWLESNLLILDIGFNTVDILYVHEGRSNAEWSNMLEGAGVCRICRDLDVELKNMGLELPEQAIKQALSVRKVSIYGKEVDLSRTIDILARDYGDYLFGEIRSRLFDVLKNTQKLIVAGGGAYYIADSFRRKFPDGFLLVPDNAEFSNARGYYKYLKGVRDG